MSKEEFQKLAEKCGVSQKDAVTILGVLLALHEIKEGVGAALKMVKDGEFGRLERIEELLVRIAGSTDLARAGVRSLQQSAAEVVK
jgi:hypothetical protein